MKLWLEQCPRCKAQVTCYWKFEPLMMKYGLFCNKHSHWVRWQTEKDNLEDMKNSVRDQYDNEGKGFKYLSGYHPI